MNGLSETIDSIFDNLTEDIANVNKYISEVNKKNKTNEAALKELYEEREIPIYEGNVLWIHNGMADMKNADCPDKICVNHQSISKARETIVCLPNKVVVEIIGGDSDKLDAMAQ